jgi:hypothetical protein
MTLSRGAGRRRVATLAAVTWFEVAGFIGLGALLWLAPFCWGGDCEATGVPESFRDGSLAIRWIGVLATIAVGCAASWRATQSHQGVRAVGFVSLGLLAVLVTVRAAMSDELVGSVVFLWLGAPTLLLLAAWVPVLPTGWSRSTQP